MQTKDGKKLQKQDCIIADASLHMRLVLWEEDVGKLQSGDSYQLENVMIQQYNMHKYLSLSGDATVTKVDDIEETETVDTESDREQEVKVLQGEIIAVLNADSYLSCV